MAPGDGGRGQIGAGTTEVLLPIGFIAFREEDVLDVDGLCQPSKERDAVVRGVVVDQEYLHGFLHAVGLKGATL